MEVEQGISRRPLVDAEATPLPTSSGSAGCELRERMVAKALQHLHSPTLTRADIAAFLATKGLTAAEIDEAFKRFDATDTEPPSPIELHLDD